MKISDLKRIAAFLDEIADEKLIGCPLGSADTLTAGQCLLGASYRAVATDLRAIAEIPADQL